MSALAVSIQGIRGGASKAALRVAAQTLLLGGIACGQAVAAPLKQSGAQEVSVAQFGAKGDGVHDDTAAIQKALQFAMEHRVAKVAFEAGKRYRLASNASQNTLVIYGENLTVEGNGATLVKDCSTPGYWGDVLDIYGLVPKRQYPNIGAYAGAAAKPARNITVEDLTIECARDIQFMNAVGVVNAENVVLRDIKVVKAPQTSFAIVAGGADIGDRDIQLVHCDARGSGYHAYRIAQQSGAKVLSVTMDGCTSEGLRNEESYEKEISGRKAHVWYRAANPSSDVSLAIRNCTFDATGEVVATQGASNLTITDSVLRGGATIAAGRASNLLIARNEIGAHRSNGYCLSVQGGSGVQVQDNTWINGPSEPFRQANVRGLLNRGNQAGVK